MANPLEKLTDETLPPTQANLIQAIRNSLVENPNNIVVVEGLSGVGKSTVIDCLINADQGITYLDPTEIRHNEAEYPTEGSIITDDTATNYKSEPIEDLLQTQNTQRPIQKFVLRGLTFDEIEEYIQNHTLQEPSHMSFEQIARYSMGIPLLANQLIDNNLTPEQAQKVVANYIVYSIGKVSKTEKLTQFAAQYLQMEIPEEVISLLYEIATTRQSRFIYQDLHNVLAKQAELNAQGLIEESPLFIATQSEIIYDQMLRNAEKDFAKASIDIYVPNLTAADLERIQNAFGYNSLDELDEQSQATRAKMFMANYRKTFFWHQDELGQQFRDPHGGSRLKRQVLNCQTFYNNGQMQIPNSGINPTTGSFFIHAHEHENMTFHPAQIGWMVESLLQQRGIAYFVNNETYGRQYVYNPQSQQIEFIEHPLNLRTY